MFARTENIAILCSGVLLSELTAAFIVGELGRVGGEEADSGLLSAGKP